MHRPRMLLSLNRFIANPPLAGRYSCGINVCAMFCEVKGFR